MPKKTRKQKIEAEKRRTATHLKILDDAPQKDVLSRYTIADLKKTLILSSLLFALEFLVFYANLKGVI